MWGDRFELISILGDGGMATVHLAHDTVRDERVALKVLHPHLARDPNMRARLRRELRAAGRIRHDAALVPHELHEHDGGLALSMPYHPGRTLAERVGEDGPLPIDEVCRLGTRLAEVLAAAHSRGVVHRDLTPQNVMLNDQGEPILTDFGMARLLDEDHTRLSTGAVGTSGYVAPEVFEGRQRDPRADLYSLGATLHFALTGEKAFAAAHPAGVLRKQLDGDRTPVRDTRPDTPEWLDGLISALLAPKTADRPAGAQEVVDLMGARRAPLPPAVPDESLPIDHAAVAPEPLPPGNWKVVVEPSHWNRRYRQQLLDAEHAEKHGPDVTAPRIDPPQALVDALEREVGLPPGSLEVNENLWQGRSRLVGGVDKETARQLSARATDAGFESSVWKGQAPLNQGEVVDTGSWAFSKLAPTYWFCAGTLLVVVWMFIVAGVELGHSLGMLPAPPWQAFMDSHPWAHWVLPVLFPLLQGPWFWIVQRARRSASSRLPLAYKRDMAGMVRSQGQTRALAHTSSDEDDAPPARLVRRARDELAAFEQMLDEQKDELPAPAARELAESVTGLGQQVTWIQAQLEAHEAELRRLEAGRDAVDTKAMARRLERLQALADTGEVVDQAEVERIRATMDLEQTTVSGMAELDAQVTAHMAQLLEICAAAAEARRALLADPTPAQASPMAEELQRRTAALRATQREQGGR